MQKIIPRVFLLVFTFFVIGCTSPGTYMGPRDVKKAILVRKNLAYPEFIEINPELFSRIRFSNQYRVGPRDILNIIVWNHPELTIQSIQTTAESININTNTTSSVTNIPAGILIDEKGETFFPLAGKLKVGGLTVDQVRILLTMRLSKYIRRPQISVRVDGFRSKLIYVIGEVSKPGIQSITDKSLNIMD